MEVSKVAEVRTEVVGLRRSRLVAEIAFEDTDFSAENKNGSAPSVC